MVQWGVMEGVYGMGMYTAKEVHEYIGYIGGGGATACMGVGGGNV